MNQQRLNIFARKVSDEELSLEEQIDRLAQQIKAQRKEIDQERDRLEQAQQRQQENGLRTAEITITDSYIKERLRPLKKYLSVLESKYEKLTKQSSKAQKLATRQSDLFSN